MTSSAKSNCIRIEERPSPEIEAIKVLHMEKDSTNYDLLVIKIRGSFGFGSVGYVTDGFLVVEGLNRRAYMFYDYPFDAGYVGEKLSGGHKLSQKDIENVMLLMKEAMSKDCSKCGHSLNNHGTTGNSKNKCLVPGCSCGVKA